MTKTDLDIVFLTGAGRCGTTLTRSLLDSNSQVNVVADHITNLVEVIFEETALTGQVNIDTSFEAFTNSFLPADFLGYKQYQTDEFRAHLREVQKELKEQAVDGYVPFQEIFYGILRKIFPDPSLPFVVASNTPNTRALLHYFPSARVILMLRNPCNQMNSEFRFLYRDPNSTGGHYPGFWDFARAMTDVEFIFREASLLKNNPRVSIFQMENLQKDTKGTITAMLQFIGTKYEEINGVITQAGERSDAGSTHGKSTKVFNQDDDWSCLTGNDLYYITRFPHITDWYDIKPSPFVKNRFHTFLFRAFGFVGKNRKKPKSLKAWFQTCIFSIGYFVQDLRYKFYLQHKWDRWQNAKR